MVNLDKATFIGEGKWVKDAALQVYEQDGRYYVVTVVDPLNKEIIDELTIEIEEKDINKYI
jgi:ribosomal protein S4E